MEVWAVRVNYDLTEGRGPMMVRQLFINKEQADDWALQQEPYNNVNQFTRVELMTVHDFESACELLNINAKREELLKEKDLLVKQVKDIDSKLNMLNKT